MALTTQIQVLSQQTAKYAIEWADGNVESFQELASTRNAIDSAVQRLSKGNTKTGMQAYGDNNASPAGRVVTALNNAWTQLTAHQQDPVEQVGGAGLGQSRHTLSSRSRCSTPVPSRW